MALTAAEKSRQWRERRREERAAELRSAKAILGKRFRRPFGDYYLDHPQSSDVDLVFELAGYQPPDFGDERGPEAFALPEAIAGLEDPFPGAIGPLGRAETLVGLLLEATSELAGIVNAYKKSEIEARIAEFEAQDLSDPATRSEALSEIVRLNKVLDQLDGQVRLSIPRWEIKNP